LFGVVLGATAAFILPYTFALYGVPFVLAIGLSVVATVIRPRPAGLAGFLIPVGAGWLIALWRATEQCVEMNRQKDASTPLRILLAFSSVSRVRASLSSFLYGQRTADGSGSSGTSRDRDRAMSKWPPAIRCMSGASKSPKVSKGEETQMRVLILAKESNQNEAATPPTPDAMAEYQKFNEELIKAGVVVGSGRLSSSAQGKRLRFDGKKRTVIDGPFAEAKELVGGYWLWDVRSMDEAIEWLRRAPYDGGTFEIREVSMYEGA